jgi:DNA-binding NarL/FixJ family response regulator
MKLLFSKLSKRQYEVYSLLQRGYTNSDIANTLFLTVNTVKTHLANIYKKLEVSNRTEAVGLITVQTREFAGDKTVMVSHFIELVIIS